MQTPPPIPKQKLSNGMSRRAKWLVVGLCLVAFLFVTAFAGLIVFGEKMMKSSSVYSEALAEAHSAPAVAAALGTPLKDGFFTTGNVSESGSSGSANYMIPISGPLGSGHLSVSATRSQGAWHLDDLTLFVDKTQKRIDLLNTNQ